MNRLAFLWAKLTQNDEPLFDATLQKSALMQKLAGKSVAIIGNARALSETRSGKEIDGADIVIRINGAPMASELSHGVKTDWIAVSSAIKDDIIAARKARLVLWMTNKRKRLPYRFMRRGLNTYLNRVQDRQNLLERVEASPTTGLMIIDLVASSQAKSIDLYGFDFFSSLSLSGRRTADQVPHDFNAEAAFVQALIEKDPRATLHPLK